MTRSAMIYAVVCIGIVALAIFALREGYVPFASAGARAPLLFGHSGPMHK